MNSPVLFPPVVSRQQKEQFAQALALLQKEALHDLSIDDFNHLKKMERWGRLCSLLGYGTAWIVPNPLSAFLISVGNLNRWANMAHPILHGGYDSIDGVPHRYTSRGFAKAWRRMIDWPDWFLVVGWNQEHNRLHHYRLGENVDPSQLEKNMRWLRESSLPMWMRYSLVAFFACIWKPIYYSQSTLRELRTLDAKKRKDTNYQAITSKSPRCWSPFHREGQKYWLQCFLPYFVFRFIFIPTLFLPVGTSAAVSVLITSVIAEIFTNLHSFLVITPNHTGDDIPRFDDATQSKSEFYYRQIVGSVNYRTGSNVNDFMHGWLNYQIEHHLWPAMPLSQYQKLQPKVQALCEQHGISYRQESVFKRLKKTVDVMVGKTTMPVESAQTAKVDVLAEKLEKIH
ncbi:MAG: fatty acid desaturase [Gammaproteobacteria bacterium]|nr:fatty acid desaturase [Gammaproteobacteria bacterium]